MLILTVIATVYFWSDRPIFAPLLVIVVAHFFLFCNVFRIVRSLELIWAGLFILNFLLWMLLNRFTWANVLAIQIPITMTFILYEMHGPREHGIFARRVKPRLDDYLNFKIE